MTLGGELLFYLLDKVVSNLGHTNSSYRYERAGAQNVPALGRALPLPRVTC